MRIEDYAVIGDTHTAALVGRDGSIDWLCLPRFDSPACFARLLGNEANGYWRLSPAGPVRACRRRYRENSLVLETELDTDEGTVRLVDCMPLRQRYPEVARMVEGVTGTVPMRMELAVRYDYGSVVPWVRRLDGMTTLVAGPEALCLWSPVETHGENCGATGAQTGANRQGEPANGSGQTGASSESGAAATGPGDESGGVMATVADFSVSPGQQVPFMLAWYPSHEDSPRPIDGRYIIEDTDRWWRDWSARCTYQGQWRDAVQRSLITLKALTYAPTGGIVAAATTSLPEALGGFATGTTATAGCATPPSPSMP